MNDRARDATLELGMTRMQAQLRAPETVLRMRSPEQEATAHASLLDCGHAFSPRVEDTALDHIVIDAPASTVCSAICRKSPNESRSAPPVWDCG